MDDRSNHSVFFVGFPFLFSASFLEKEEIFILSRATVGHDESTQYHGISMCGKVHVFVLRSVCWKGQKG